MDYWVSYIVYFFDINFKESFDIIAENDYLNRIIDRIPYSNPSTKKQMEKIRTYMQKFIILTFLVHEIKELTYALSGKQILIFIYPRKRVHHFPVFFILLLYYLYYVV